MHIDKECTAGAKKYSDHSELCKVSSDTFITVQLSRLRAWKKKVLPHAREWIWENIQSIALRVGAVEDN